jgi:hypothetical protein
MLGRETKDHGEHDERNRALFLSGQNEHPEPVAQAHLA